MKLTKHYLSKTWLSQIEEEFSHCRHVSDADRKYKALFHYYDNKGLPVAEWFLVWEQLAEAHRRACTKVSY